MNESEIIKKCKGFLDSNKIPYLDSPEIDVINEDIVEVIFLKPETIDPNVLGIDPPDVIVSLNIKTGEMDIVPQM